MKSATQLQWLSLISSPEPKAEKVSLYDGHALASVRRPSSSTISKIFSSETTWPIKAKLHVEHPQERGMKVYLNGLGHVTKMAAMPIYGKNHKKILSGTNGLNSTKLGM